MRLLIGLGILHVLFACSSGSKVFQGKNSTSETSSTEGSTDSSVETSALDTAESYTETDTVADEPVSVGGAFLACHYKSGHQQGSESYQMDCEVGPVAEVRTAIAKADFFKLDSNGNRTALLLVSEDLLALKWTIQESSSTLPYDRVEVVLSANNSTPTSLTTSIKTPLVLAQVASFWLAGEPNNLLVTSPEGEDCAEFGNLAAKIDHQNRTGLIAGPLGRMNDIACNARSSSFLCRNISGDKAAKWVVSTFQGTFLDSADACPAGYSFGFPFDENEVKEVSALIDGNQAIQNIWVNMNDRAKENEFVVMYR